MMRRRRREGHGGVMGETTMTRSMSSCRDQRKDIQRHVDEAAAGASAADVVDDDTQDSSRRRSPFPIEDFEEKGFPTSARFLWASRGLTAGSGLKPLDAASDWLEQDGEGDPDDKGDCNWVREMRRRHELIEADCGCTVWVGLLRWLAIHEQCVRLFILRDMLR